MIHDHPYVTSDELANWLWGKSKIGESGDAYRLARRLTEIYPAGTPEHNALRRGMLQTILTNAPDKTQPGAQAMAENLSGFVRNGNGRSVATLLFSPAELSQLRRYAAALRTTIPDPTATNPSKSGYEMARAVIDTFAAGVGQPVRLLANMTVNLPTIVSASQRAAPVVRTPSNPAWPALGAVGAERYLDEERDRGDDRTTADGDQPKLWDGMKEDIPVISLRKNAPNTRFPRVVSPEPVEALLKIR